MAQSPLTSSERGVPLATGPSRLPETLAALRYRDFRLLTFGTGFAIGGWWMIIVAQGWLVLEMSNSAFWVATASSAMALPSLILGPVAGVAADRLDRRRLLLVTRSIVIALGLIEGIMILTEVIRLWEVLLLAAVTGSAFAMDIPARQSLVPDTVPESVLPNGIAINVSVFSLAAIIGPAAGAAVLATVGAGGCFIANAVGNVALVAAIALLRTPDRTPSDRTSVLADFTGGLRFVRNSPVVLLLLLTSMLGVLGNTPWRELAPVFVRDVFGGTEAGLGALYTGSGVGAVIGAGLLLWLSRSERRSLIYGGAITLGIVAVLGFSTSPTIQVAVGFALLSGVANQLSGAMAQTVILLQTPDRFRGRMMSLWMLLWGLQPAATLISGVLADAFEPRIAVAGMAAMVGLLIVTLGIRMRSTWRAF